jgi:hypothetical protein
MARSSLGSHYFSKALKLNFVSREREEQKTPESNKSVSEMCAGFTPSKTVMEDALEFL